MCDDCEYSKIRVYLKIQFMSDRERSSIIINILQLMLFIETGCVNCEHNTKHIHTYIHTCIHAYMLGNFEVLDDKFGGSYSNHRTSKG
jgi:hypothetical protein